MPQQRVPGTLVVLVVLAAALLAAGSGAGATRPIGAYTPDLKFERTMIVDGPVRLDVSTAMGNIVVRTGEVSEVRVAGYVRIPPGMYPVARAAERHLRELVEQPPIEQKGRRIRIGPLKDRDLNASLAISYEIIVPPETELRASTGLGDQVIEGLTRRVNATCGAGNLEVSGISAEVRLATGLGDVVVRGVEGSVRISSRSGHIRAEGIPTGRWLLGTELGDVLVRLPAGAGFDLHARSAVGGIQMQHPLEPRGPAVAGELHGKVRGGGPKIELQTGLGSIRIE